MCLHKPIIIVTGWLPPSPPNTYPPSVPISLTPSLHPSFKNISFDHSLAIITSHIATTSKIILLGKACHDKWYITTCTHVPNLPTPSHPPKPSTDPQHMYVVDILWQCKCCIDSAQSVGNDKSQEILWEVLFNTSCVGKHQQNGHQIMANFNGNCTPQPYSMQ